MVGQGAVISGLSYLAVGRENVFKTYNTCTAGLPFISCALKTMRESKTIEQISGHRTHSHDIQLQKKIEGEFEGYAFAEATGMAYLLQNAFGGTITSATATGETAGGTAFDHQIDIGNFDQSISSICLNHRKGDSATGKVFQYNGVRINELTFSAEMDEALKYSTSIVGIDSTVGSNDVSGALGSMDFEPLSFVGGRISIADSVGSLTTTSYWHVQAAEIGISNSIKSDSASGRIGSELLDVLPPGIASFTFNVTMRFDTTTAYDAMLAGTRLAGEFEFLGSTITGSSLRKRIKIVVPKLKVSDSGDPEIGGPDEFLTSEVAFNVLRDVTLGYAMRLFIRNAISSY